VVDHCSSLGVICYFFCDYSSRVDQEIMSSHDKFNCFFIGSVIVVVIVVACVLIFRDNSPGTRDCPSCDNFMTRRSIKCGRCYEFRARCKGCGKWTTASLSKCRWCKHPVEEIIKGVNPEKEK